MRFRYPILTLSLLLSLAFSAGGQGRDALRDYRYIVQTNPFLRLDNAAGIGHLPIDRIAVAEGAFVKDNGGLKGPDDSPDDWCAAGGTESYVKVSDKVTFYGRMGYSYFQGQEMGGSLLAGFSSAPLNFYEMVDSTAALRTRESYSLTGAMAYRFNSRWSAGVAVDYRTGNQVKHRDPRSRSALMDISVRAGAQWSVSDRKTIGLNLEYSRNLEELRAQQYGTTDKMYYIFVDYGACYGIKELFSGDEGFVSLSNPRYLDDTRLGGSLQFYSDGDLQWFHQLTYLHRDGYYGKRSSSTVVFCDFGGHEAAYSGSALLKRGSDTDRFSADLSFTLVNNYLNVYKKTTEPGKSTVVAYYGRNLILSAADASARLAWDAWRGVSDFRAESNFGASLDGSFHRGITTIYPYKRTAQIITLNAEAYGERSFRRGASDILTLRAEGTFLMGFGNPAADRQLATSSSPAPLSFDARLNRQFEYETAPRAGLALGCTYTRIFSEKFSAYVRLQDGLSLLLRTPQYLDGRLRNTATLTVGCTF